MIPDLMEDSTSVLLDTASTVKDSEIEMELHQKEAVENVGEGGEHLLSDGQGLLLDHLPIEILQHIGGFLQPREILYSLCGASQRLYQIFREENYWRIRLKRKWPATYPIISDRVPKPAVWRHRCRDRELHFNLFNNSEKQIEKRIFGIGQGGLVGGDVNAVCFGSDGKFLATGGRDRHVIIWDLEGIKKSSVNPSDEDSSAHFQNVLHTHGGWVWSLRSNGCLLSSGAWDCTISIADLNHSGDTKSPKTTLKSDGSVTCHTWEKNLLVAGTFIGGIALFDPRSDIKPVMKKSQSHHGAVLGVHLDGNKVILVGSDKKLQILDLRSNEFFLKKNMPNNDYGTQLCVEDGNIWVGTKRGQVFLYDQDDFELVEDLTSAIGHNNQITGLHCDAGHVLTCAMDRSARMNQPTRSADLIWQYQADAGFTAMDFSRNCLLALAWGPVVGVWWPKDDL